MRGVLLCLGALLTAAVSAGFVALPEPAAVRDTRGGLDPTQAFATVQNERWMVWRTQDMLGDRRQADRRTIRTRIYRQRIGANAAELMFEQHGQRIAQAVGIFLDGSVVIHDQDEILLIDRHGNPRPLEIDLPGHKDAKPLLGAAFDEGIFVQPMPMPKRGGVSAAPMYFVPFQNGALDTDAAMEVTEGDGIRPRVNRPMARSGPEIVWHDEQGLHVLDIHALEVRNIPAKGKNAAYNEVRAFDGRYVALRTEVIDLNTNNKVTALGQAYPVAIRDGVLYEFAVERANPGPSFLVLTAKPLTGNKARTTELKRCDAYNFYTGYSSSRPASVNNNAWQAVHVGDAGIRLFDGQAWTTVPYVEPDTDDNASR